MLYSGIDIGDTHVRGVCIQLKSNELGIKHYDEIEIKDGDRQRALAAIVEGLPKNSRTGVTLSINAMTMRSLQFPFRDEKKIREGIKFKIEASLNSKPEDFIVDLCPCAPEVPGNESAAVTVNALAIDGEYIASCLAELAELGCDPESIGVDLFATTNFILEKHKQSSAPFVVVGIEDAGTRFALIDQQCVVFMRNFPQGLDWVKQKMSQRCKGSERAMEQALWHENVKDAVLTIRNDFINTLAKQVKRTLMGLQLSAAPECIFLLGPGSTLPQIDANMQNMTGYDTVVLSAISGLSQSKETPHDEVPAVYAAAIGQALAVAGQNHCALDFRQEAYSFKGAQEKLNKGIAFMIVAATILFCILSVNNYRTSEKLGIENKALAKGQWDFFNEIFPTKGFYKKRDLTVKRALEAEKNSLVKGLPSQRGDKKNTTSALKKILDISKALPISKTNVLQRINLRPNDGQLSGTTKSIHDAEKMTSQLNGVEYFKVESPDVKPTQNDLYHFSTKIKFSMPSLSLPKTGKN